MLKKVFVIASLWSLCSVSSALGQSQNGKLALLIPQLFGPEGLIVDTTTPPQQQHRAHFFNAFQSEFTQFNTALANQLTALPLPLRRLALPTRSTPPPAPSPARRKLRPILAERAETIGKRKFTVGFSYQRFTYDSVEGGDLNQVRAVFTHDDLPANFPPNVDSSFVTDIVTTVNTVESTSTSRPLYFTYGVTDRLDVSLAIPTVHASLNVSSVRQCSAAFWQRPKYSLFCRFFGAWRTFGNTRMFSSSGSATGIGD